LVWVVVKVVFCCVPVEDFFSKGLCFFQRVRYSCAIGYKRRVLVLWDKFVPGDNLEEFLAVLSIVYDVPPVLPFSLSDCGLEDSGFF
jgi:hypothetical protein